MAHLKAIGGGFHGRCYEIDKSITIGRGINADIQVLMAGISRSHCKIIKDGNDFILQDLKSINGTKVNGKLVNSQKLEPGDLLEICKAKYKFNDPVGLQVSSAKGVHELNMFSRSGDVSPTGTFIDGNKSRFFKYDELENHSKQDLLQKLMLMTSVAQDISSSLSLEQLMIKLMDKILALNPNTDSCIIVLRDKDNVYRPHHIRYSSDQKVPYHDLFVHEALKTPAGMIKNISVKIAESSNKQSIMIAPVVYLEDMLGFIQMQSKLNSAFYINEDLSMIRAIASQVASAIATAKMHDEILQQQRIQQDLEIAQRVQLNFLPNTSPNVKGYELTSTYVPALQVGGDFFNYIHKKDDLFVTIGDVSGKGIPAALVMAKLTSEIKFLCTSHSNPAKVFSIVNKAFDKECSDDFFATSLLLKIDIKTGRVAFVNAGHHAPIIIKNTGGLEEIEGGDIPLGTMPDTEFSLIETQLDHGDFMVLYTDGVTETVNKRKQELGLDGLLATLNDKFNNAKEVNKAIVGSIAKFRKQTPQKDDITIITIYRNHQEFTVTETPLPGIQKKIFTETDLIDVSKPEEPLDFLDDESNN